MEGSLVAYKVFTNGSVLQASEVNDNLMNQAVAVFSNAAARTAAITSPVEGQLTYLEDTNQYASWTGSSWGSPFGMTLVGSATLSAATQVNVNNVFTSQFRNYIILIEATKSGATDIQLTLRLRAGASDDTSAVYDNQNLAAFSSTVVSNSSASQNIWTLATGARNSQIANLTLFSPQLATPTRGLMNGFVTDIGANPIIQSNGMAHRNNFQADGFTAFFAGAANGSIRVYGCRD
jgi:hypothetical protein